MLCMRLEVCQNILISIGDLESVLEDMNDSTDAEVCRGVKHRVIHRGARLGSLSTLQELAANDPSIPDWWFIDRQHVISQTIGNDKTAVFLFWFEAFLKR